MSTPGSGPTAVRRRLVLAGAAVVVVALVVLGIVLSARGGDGSSGRAPAASAGSASGTATTAGAGPQPMPSATTPPASSPTAPSGAPAGSSADLDQAPPTLPAVPLASPADAGDGITARVVRVAAIQAEGTGPGNVSGPALQVTVRVDNGTGQPLAADQIAVALAYGPDSSPASPVDDPSVVPFTGTVRPGGSAQGVAVFSVPADDRGQVAVTVAYRAGSPLLAFTGSAN